MWVYWKRLPFDQSSCVILLTRYCWLYFFPWIPLGYPLNGSIKDFLSNHREGRGRAVNRIQFLSISVSFSSMYFFFISKLRCSSFRKSFCWLGFPIGSLVIRILRPKFHVFSTCFFCLTPLRLQCSTRRKTALFLTSYRLNKYKNLHPRSFKNRAKSW